MTVADLDPHKTDAPIPSLASLAAMEAPLFLPWSTELARIGTGFDSRLIDNAAKKAWVPKCAFQNLEEAVALCETAGCTTSFREGSTDSTSSSSEHMSMSLGVTVGNKLLSANVTGSYDSRIELNQNAYRVSKHCSYRAGRVILTPTPRLTDQARCLLEKDPGRFRDEYGDYYIAGLQLGADAGCSLSVAASSESRTETTKLSVTVHVLFWDATAETEDTQSSQTSAFALNFMAYDTLTHSFVEQHCAEGAQTGSIKELAKRYMQAVLHLQASVDRKLVEWRVSPSAQLSIGQCQALCGTGVVSHLVLEPYSHLLEVRRLQATVHNWKNTRNSMLSEL
ncbi:hypothetical protein G647_00242 [Cladophialophora carrionii CBS 160.54]|uniref:Uncharacterized protein n=1 Tax=Cladophialophora carrionii CBS 160.54 TaxID=1279043 RepID=V9DN95_9EURO|nr:uncharacterized protein G647_00242 [Cladophialophora carrionii CBS 160.54]ETI27793.1 hypothetical protein G647_00242 [Cladophialophora carrionii CBS 160.54]